MAHTDEDLTSFVSEAPAPEAGGGESSPRRSGTGPSARPTAMPEVFEVLMHAARNELLVTTPYYVPSDAMHDGLCLTGAAGGASSGPP